MKNKILEIFEKLCVSHKDYLSEERSEKLVTITEFLKTEKIQYEYIDKIGLIVNKQEKPEKVVVSHMDLIPLFNNSFIEGIKGIKLGKECISGPLDNTITNAVMLLAIKKLKNSNVEFLFSEAEEIGFFGVREYLKENRDRLKDSFFINLDVTSEGYKYAASVEYDCCNFENLKKVQALKKNFFFTADREGDDMCEIKRQGFHGFSYCLPTKNNIHSFKNKARLESLEPYYQGLISLIKNCDLISAEKDIFAYEFEKALVSDKKPKQTKKPSFLDYPELDHSDYSEEDFNSSFHELAAPEEKSFFEVEFGKEAMTKTENFITFLSNKMSTSSIYEIESLAYDNYFRSLLFEVCLAQFSEGKYFFYKDLVESAIDNIFIFEAWCTKYDIFYISEDTYYLTDQTVSIIS